MTNAVEERPITVWRCPKCSRILAKLRVDDTSYVQVKCGSCNNIAEKGER